MNEHGSQRREKRPLLSTIDRGNEWVAFSPGSAARRIVSQAADPAAPQPASMKPIRFAFLAVAFAGIGGAHATPRTAEPRPPVLAPAPQALLDAHNRLRRAEGVPPLRWSPALAAGAQQWAERLAGSGGFEHSHAPGLGENLAALSPPGRYPMQSFLDLWIGERRVFTSGRFPQVSTTGDWTDVGHYTQMIWRTTTQVGCGLADSAAQSILVCRYAPAGNVIGETVY